MKKSSFIIIFLIGLVISLSIAKSIVYNNLSTSGVFVSKVEEEITHYKTQNAILSEKLLSESSLATLSSRALSLGFVEGKSQYMVTSSQSLAIRQ